MANNNLTAAKVAKNDEFYTRLEDIEKEVWHYKDHLKNKVIYCNCDDARVSNFVRYFKLNFKFFGLKKLIATGFKINGRGVKYIYEGGDDNMPVIPADVTEMDFDGDFRSDECVELLKEADIVVTNPPFSLFREFVEVLMEYGKKFLIIGNLNSITCKEIFPLVKENKLWLGVNMVKEFLVPLNEIENAQTQYQDKTGNVHQKFGNIFWFTNLPHARRNTPLILCKWYEDNYKGYPKYDNYDAIEVSKVDDIPLDYQGVIGVPITFIDKYCPEQFEIIGLAAGNTNKSFKELEMVAKHIPNFPNDKGGCPVINNKTTYVRILIRHKHPISKAEYFNQLNPNNL